MSAAGDAPWYIAAGVAIGGALKGVLDGARRWRASERKSDALDRAELRDEWATLRTEVKNELAQCRADRDELESEVSALRTEIGALTTEVGRLRRLLQDHEAIERGAASGKAG